MPHIEKWLGVAGALGGACAVIAGAMGAHLLQLEPGSLRAHQFDTAVNYLFVHAAVVLLGQWCRPAQARLWDVARATMMLGMVLFSGGLLLKIASGWSVPVIPAGGISLIAGWIIAAIAVAKSTQKGGQAATGQEEK